MIDTIASYDGRLAKISGGCRTGKTEALIRRVVKLIDDGADPGSILVIVSTAIAASEFAGRLSKELKIKRSLSEAVRILTAEQACIEVLDTPEAIESTQRIPRILTNFEYTFFLEDMKTTGQSARSLKKIITRFEHAWADNVPEEEWFFPETEEGIIVQHAMQLLKTQRCMLRDEAAYICARYLQSEDGKDARGRYSYVLADDFQNLSRSEQVCVCLLAKDQLMVAGNVNETVACGSPYPYPEGFASFDELRHGVENFLLDTAYGNPDVTRFVDAIADAEEPGSSETTKEHEGSGREITYVKWPLAQNEFNDLTKFIRIYIRTLDLVEKNLCVVVPNKRWAKVYTTALSKRHFKVADEGAYSELSGDPRDMAKCAALIAYTKLNLLANPDDVVAWRCWCGYGNYLTNSDLWNHLMRYAEERECGLLDALAGVAADVNDGKSPFAKADVLASRYEEAKAFIDKNSSRKGFILLRSTGMEDLHEYNFLDEIMIGDETPQALYASIRSMELYPNYPADPHMVRISSYENLVGCSYDTLVFTGCVDGLMPERDAFEVVSTDHERERIMRTERRLFLSGVSKATNYLVLSTFSRADLELAEKTKMKVVRVRADDGKRIAILRPTTFINEAGHYMPSVIGGQALMAEWE
ncbi:MAG: UvrD-helicase domain-containing protein [Eggerthellaceae bacterium]|nr:UvrD-helicase domain-containing protein [Eggerthellaceae bacterium]